LYAINEWNGKIMWQQDIQGGSWTTATYGEGRVFVCTSNAILKAYEAADGTLQWSTTLPGQDSCSSPPTYADGMVFAGCSGNGGTVYGVSAITGQVLWTQGVENGYNSSPAVLNSRVYVSYAGDQAYCINERTGALVWHHQGPSEGGGGRTVAVTSEAVYTRDGFGDLRLNLTNGQTETTYDAGYIPAFAFGYRFTMIGGTLQAVDTATQANAWSFTGDGSLSSAPIVVDNVVFVGSTNGYMYGLDCATGKGRWKAYVGSVESPDEQNLVEPLTGLAAGDGLIVIPATNVLVAFASR
jgi:outer membrane protein assembly factor BamB